MRESLDKWTVLEEEFIDDYAKQGKGLGMKFADAIKYGYEQGMRESLDDIAQKLIVEWNNGYDKALKNITEWLRKNHKEYVSTMPYSGSVDFDIDSMIEDINLEFNEKNKTT